MITTVWLRFTKGLRLTGNLRVCVFESLLSLLLLLLSCDGSVLGPTAPIGFILADSFTVEKRLPTSACISLTPYTQCQLQGTAAMNTIGTSRLHGRCEHLCIHPLMLG
jgi:hypothetical protein